MRRAAPSGGGPAQGREAAGATAPDLSAYRQRADELRRRLESATDAARELGVLALKLEDLLDDLRSVGASDDDRRPLTDLLAELRTFLAQPAPAAGEVADQAKRAGEALTAFATGAKPKRRGWWK
jgi:hypothetical protein